MSTDPLSLARGASSHRELRRVREGLALIGWSLGGSACLSVFGLLALWLSGPARVGSQRGIWLAASLITAVGARRLLHLPPPRRVDALLAASYCRTAKKIGADDLAVRARGTARLAAAMLVVGLLPVPVPVPESILAAAGIAFMLAAVGALARVATLTRTLRDRLLAGVPGHRSVA